MKEKVSSEIKRLVNFFEQKQYHDGAWRFCYESGIMSDAYMIILLRTLDFHDEILIRKLVERLTSRQEENGAWKLYDDEEEGNLSATVDSYYALLFSGYSKENESHMVKAKKYILDKGGLGNAGLLTKVMLALTGQYPWPDFLKIPMEILLIPPTFPINFFDFVGYARVHFVPVMICANKSFSMKTERTPNLSSLIIDAKHQDISNIENDLVNINSLVREIYYLPKRVREFSYKTAEQFMLARIEPDGTLYSYFSTTFLMIFALLALGYSKNSPIILNAVNGLKTFICKTDGSIHLQNSTSTIWDTTLISHTLQEAGLSVDSPVIQKAGLYILSKQQYFYGDWVVHNPNVLPGGWGFSDSNTINPDVDDTTAALRAIYMLARINKTYLRSWKKGIRWVLSMQNNDGGWPAFEKNTNKEILTFFVQRGTESVTIDPSSADLTGRTLEFFGNYAGFNLSNPNMMRAVKWLIRNQERNGSWFGRWGISYIYGTWAAVTGMKAVGFSSNHPTIKKATKWLLEIQNDDGGWGESCKSDIVNHYVPLNASTPSQTAWAIDALIAVHDNPTPEINQGIQRLIDFGTETDWRTSYPTGAGLADVFYTNYHSYRYVWPLLALSNYQKKYN